MLLLLSINNWKLKLKYIPLQCNQNHKTFRGKFSKICVRPLHRKLKYVAERNLRSPKEMERYTIFMDWLA